MTEISIAPLMEIVGLQEPLSPETIKLTERMSGLEESPKHDWLYVGLTALKKEAEQCPQIRSAAFIGSGNGIDVVGALRCFDLDNIIATDVLPDILDQIRENVERNTLQHRLPQQARYIAGRDCEPLTEKVDLIYANLPLIMVDNDNTNQGLATTTLTDGSFYQHLATGSNDFLLRWSLLSQLGFLISAKTKLTEHGTIITLIGGRIPYAAFEECFRRADLEYEQVACAVMRQSDPEFLKQYAEHEQRINPDTFVFYDEKKAAHIIEKEGSYPDIVSFKDVDLRKVLEPAQISAEHAYQLYYQKKHVAHIAYAFRATLKK